MIESSNCSFEPEKSPEVKKITREEVVAAYKKFVDQGITNPDDVGLDEKANELFEAWQKQEDKLVDGNKELRYSNNLAKTMLKVDAGFTDPDYLDEVLEWLNNDLDELKEQEDNIGVDDIRNQIIEAIKKVEALIDKHNKK